MVGSGVSGFGLGKGMRFGLNYGFLAIMGGFGIEGVRFGGN